MELEFKPTSRLGACGPQAGRESLTPGHARAAGNTALVRPSGTKRERLGVRSDGAGFGPTPDQSYNRIQNALVV